MAPLVRRLQNYPNLAVTVCSTGQHREMIHQVFRLFSILPELDLDVMQPGQTLSDLTARVLSGMDGIMRDHKPDRCLFMATLQRRSRRASLRITTKYRWAMSKRDCAPATSMRRGPKR